MNKSSLVLEVLTFNNQYIVSLLESGRCSIHDKCKLCKENYFSFPWEKRHFMYINKLSLK